MNEQEIKIWDEKNLIEHNKNLTKEIVINQEDITNEIDKESVKNECRNISLKKSGIYKIIHKESGKYYVGSSVNINKRWREHKTKLNKNCHNNFYLQNAWNKYGSDSFEFQIVEYVDNVHGRHNNRLLEVEQKYLDIAKYDKDLKINSHYNLCYHVNKTTLGYKLSQETKLKIKNTSLGRKHTEESKRLMSELQKGYKNSFYGKKHTKETIVKIFEKRKKSYLKEKHPFYGKQHSQEHKDKISASLKGRFVSEETRLKISKLHKGRKLSEESILKIREKRLGIPNLKNKGNKNGSYDKTIHNFINKNLNINRKCTCYELTEEFSLLRRSVTDLVKKRIKQHHGWTVSE